MGKADLVLAVIAAGSIVVGSLLGINKPDVPPPEVMNEQIQKLQQEVEVLRMKLEND